MPNRLCVCIFVCVIYFYSDIVHKTGPWRTPVTYCPGFGGAPAAVIPFNSGNTEKKKKKKPYNFSKSCQVLQAGAQKSK